MTNAAPAERDVAGVIAPPPLIFGGFLVLGLALGFVWPAPLFDADVAPTSRYAIGAALAVAGIGIAVIGFLQFRRAGTDVRPDRPSTALVTDGVFGLSRNPLYVSQTLVYLGIALAANNAWAFGLIVPTLLVIRFGVIARRGVSRAQIRRGVPPLQRAGPALAVSAAFGREGASLGRASAARYE